MITTRDRIPVGGNRLDPMLITDPLVRARLYADMRERRPYRSAGYWLEYTVSPGERFMPELIAVRAWNDENLKWAVLVVAEVDDHRREVESGITLTLPTREWLRDRIKFYQAMDAIAAPTGDLIRIGSRSIMTLPEPPPEPPTASAGFGQQLSDAIAALTEPLPVLLPSDSMNEEQLNKQARAIDERMQALSMVLDAWRQMHDAVPASAGLPETGFDAQLLAAGMAASLPAPDVLPANDLNEQTLNKQANDTYAKLSAMRALLEAWNNG